MTYSSKSRGTARRRSVSTFRMLFNDQRGNVLALVGAALLPLMAIIGSGVDMSRAYLARTRLQAACDAAALAGRRVLVNDSLTEVATDPVRVEATKFFNFNFKPGLYETAPITPTITKPAAGTIRIEASTAVPTAVMQLFGYQTLPLAVSCEASQNFVNTDIILVLDVTGSMESLVSTGEVDNRGNPIRVRRIEALRDAVLALYDELAPIQEELEAAGLRLRYGIVPYAMNVNVGALLRAEGTEAGTSYIASTWSYQTRVREVDTEIKTSSDCDNYPGWSWSAGKCTIWKYKQAQFDTSSYITGAATTNPAGTGTSNTWSGCVEERQTVSTITASWNSGIPDGAYDLQINMLPNSGVAGSLWGPYWPEVIYLPTNTNQRTGTPLMDYDDDTDTNQYRIACPPAAERLRAWDREALDDYVEGLEPDGYTYHDIGLIWGARLISDQGIFGEDNPTTFNDFPVNKHIIFMTDGELNPVSNAYSSWGYENLDKRVTGGGGELYGRHEKRFELVCDATKGMDVSIWVVAFASSVSDAMEDCATSESQAFESTDRADLIAKFVQIGKNIGALRLTQ